MITSCMDQRDERKRTSDEASKSLDDTKTGAFTPFRDEHGRCPTYCPCGVRCVGGVTLIRALVRNLRTWPAMPREKAQAAPTARPKVPMRRRGADCPVVAMKRGNARGAKGAGHRHLARVNRQREEPDVQWKAAAFARWHEPYDARVSSPVL